MSLTKPKSLPTQGVNVFPGSSPASVVFRDTFYLFYAGSGFDGVWVTSTTESIGKTWQPIQNLNTLGAKTLGIAQGTSPAVVEYKDALYLFFNGSGRDGIYVTKFNGQTWTQVAKVEIANTKLNENSSPCVAVFEGLLYLFYTSNSGIFWTSFDGNAWKTSWTQLRGVFVAPGTSPSAAVFNDKLYLFFNGIANDGTWYSTCFGGKFAVQPIPMTGTNGGMTFRPGTNPDAAVLNGGYLFRLFWVDDATQTVFYSDSVDGGNWKPQKKLSCDGEAPIPGKNTGVDMCLFKERPYMFWTSVSGGISVSQGFVWDI
ncbi:hypothetical protein TWF970_001655 [Orbilia oligospora]|uniref:Uncharacterized protein n=1 Tax=Orbilia oligospora TaxID=2813651 RepID=A0A7C8V9U3_ORBOL|nr:hypothetical protein TWF970_001655 [Orbilia oligospora]